MRTKRLLAALLLCSATCMPLCAADTLAVDTTVYLPRSAFTIAGDPRYTPTGGTPRRETDVQIVPTIALGSTYAALAIALHINQANAWWKEDRGPFNFAEDWPYALQVDKLGHIFAGHFMSTFIGDLLMDCGFKQETATILGGTLGLAYQTYVEVEDGFATKWGFSPSDGVANVLGAGFYVAQYYVPYLQNFTWRWSYVPSRFTGGNELNARPTTFIDDYTSTTFWLAVDVDRMLPTSAAAYWPDWMMVSAGYGIRDYDHIPQGATTPLEPTRRFMIGLDYNWARIIPESSIGIVNYIRQLLNHMKLPGPTLEFSHTGTQFHLLYPFRIGVGGVRF